MHRYLSNIGRVKATVGARPRVASLVTKCVAQMTKPPPHYSAQWEINNGELLLYPSVSIYLSMFQLEQEYLPSRSVLHLPDDLDLVWLFNCSYLDTIS